MSEPLLHKRFGLTHPTWAEPTCFNYDSAEEAAAAIRRVYGPDAKHLVVEVVTSTPPTVATEGDGGEGR